MPPFFIVYQVFNIKYMRGISLLDSEYLMIQQMIFNNHYDLEERIKIMAHSAKL